MAGHAAHMVARNELSEGGGQSEGAAQSQKATLSNPAAAMIRSKVGRRMSEPSSFLASTLKVFSSSPSEDKASKLMSERRASLRNLEAIDGSNLTFRLLVALRGLVDDPALSGKGRYEDPTRQDFADAKKVCS